MPREAVDKPPQNENVVVHPESTDSSSITQRLPNERTFTNDSSRSTGSLFKSSKPGGSESKEMKSTQKTMMKP